MFLRLCVILFREGLPTQNTMEQADLPISIARPPPHQGTDTMEYGQQVGVTLPTGHAYLFTSYIRKKSSCIQIIKILNFRDWRKNDTLWKI